MRVGFTGAYCTANFGDWAILINNIIDINAQENVIFTYSDSFPHRAVKYYCSGRNYIMKEVCLKERENKSVNFTPFECMEAVDNLDEIIDLIKKIDILCVSGGGYFDDNWCGRTDKFIKMVTPILVAEQFNKEIVFMAQGIGPIIKTKELMRYFFRYLKNPSIAVRDDYCSPSYLAEIGVEQKNIYHLPDDLLIINQSLVKNDDFISDAPYVVIIVHDSMEYIHNNIDIFDRFISKMKNLYNVNTVFLPFDLVWYGYDQSKYLYNTIPGCDFVDIKKDGFPAIEMVYSCIKNASLVLTGRYHASVVSLQTKTPFIVRLKCIDDDIGYSYNKVCGILKKVFSGMSFNERHFMSTSWEKIFSEVTDNYFNIIKYQTNLLDSEALKINTDKMYKERYQYIQKKFRKKG